MMISAPLVRCRGCGDDDLHFFRSLPSWVDAKAIEYRACGKCRTIVDTSASVPDYSDDCSKESFDASWKYYLEFGAGVHFMASLLELLRLVLPPRSQGSPARFLDVGAGMGFCADIARNFGWDAIGVEPSRRGQIGAELFGIPILNRFLEQTDLPKNSYQAIL